MNEEERIKFEEVVQDKMKYLAKLLKEEIERKNKEIANETAVEFVEGLDNKKKEKAALEKFVRRLEKGFLHTLILNNFIKTLEYENFNKGHENFNNLLDQLEKE